MDGPNVGWYLIVAAIGGVVLGMRSQSEQEADQPEAAP